MVEYVCAHVCIHVLEQVSTAYVLVTSVKYPHYLPWSESCAKFRTCLMFVCAGVPCNDHPPKHFQKGKVRIDCQCLRLSQLVTYNYV